MPTANLTMNVREVAEGVRVIDVEGEITAFSDQQIAEAHEEAGEGASAVILNFEGLEYMNSGGIGLLVTTLIRRSGRVMPSAPTGSPITIARSSRSPASTRRSRSTRTKPRPWRADPN